MKHVRYAVVVQLARTSPCQGEGRRFESGLPLTKVLKSIKSKVSKVVTLDFKDFMDFRQLYSGVEQPGSSAGP